MKILAIDPGTTKSGWCILSDSNILGSGVMDNNDLRLFLKQQDYDVLAIEMIASYGKTVGREVFETCVWIGRFMELSNAKVQLITRKEVKTYLRLRQSSNDSDIRKALIYRFGDKGTKDNKGKTYGVSSHAWSALAVALTYQIKTT